MRRLVVTVVTAMLLAAACGGSGGGAAPTTAGPPPTTAPSTTASTTTTTRPVVWKATQSASHALPGDYRQGIARVDGGWLVTTNDAIYRTDDAFRQTGSLAPAIPAALAAQGYDHMGDGDVADGMFWVPLERDDKSIARQVTARYDAKTLRFVDSFVVPQHHNAFVTVADDGTVWSTDEFSDDHLVHYAVHGTTVEPLPPLPLSALVANIQGGDFGDGALWLSTDDAYNAIYRVDMRTGSVTAVGTLGHISAKGHGEGEGIDATDRPSGLLHALVSDERYVPMWGLDLRVASAPGS